MSPAEVTDRVLAATPRRGDVRTQLSALVLIALGVLGLGLGAAIGPAVVVWVAIYTATVFTIGLAVAGVVFSAIFELTAAKWGRAYRRLGEASVALMPIGVLGLVVILTGGDAVMPWLHAEHLSGGKAVWLTRGFWSLRVLFCLALAYGVSLAFVYYSWRRDFCSAAVRAPIRPTKLRGI